MRRTANLFLILFLLAGSSLMAAADEAEVLVALERLAASEKIFDVLIEQNGTIAPISGHRIELERGPLTFILLFKEPLGVLVNFSFEETLFNGFRDGKSLSDILEDPDLFMGMGEDLFNPEEEIWIDPVAPHYFFYESGENHRFSKVIKNKAGIICRRVISYFRFEAGGSSQIPVKYLPSENLFVSLLLAEYDESYNRVEQQRGYLELFFR